MLTSSLRSPFKPSKASIASSCAILSGLLTAQRKHINGAMATIPQAKHLNAYHALLEAEFLALLHTSGKYKERSEKTHDKIHIPTLENQIPQGPIKCLLLGSSMVERFRTTGRAEKFGQADSQTLFNAGVGGDKIQSVLYRLGAKDLYSALKQRGVSFTILQIGTNDVRKNRALTSQDIDHYGLALEALYRMSSEMTMLVGGIYYRQDIPSEIVDQTNAALRQLVVDCNSVIGAPRVHFVTPSPEIQSNIFEMQVDHVHLNEEGYKRFAQRLLEKLKELGLEL